MPPLSGRGCWGATGAFWALQVWHVAIGQVGHKAAVRQTPPEEVHGCDRREASVHTGELGEVQGASGQQQGAGGVGSEELRGSTHQKWASQNSVYLLETIQ